MYWLYVCGWMQIQRWGCQFIRECPDEALCCLLIWGEPIGYNHPCLQVGIIQVPQKQKIMTNVQYIKGKKEPYSWLCSSVYFHNSVFLHRNLPSYSKDPPDTYISFILLPDKNRNTKRKTSVKKKSLKPEFNERLVRTSLNHYLMTHRAKG